MKHLFHDIIGFIKTLNQIDFLLYIAVLVLLILIVSLIYIIKTSDEDEEDEEEEYIEEQNKIEIETENEEGSIDLKEIVETLESTDVPPIDITEYEKEQEEKAIISYDELIEKNNAGAINYEEEKLVDNEVSVKKVDIEKTNRNEEQEYTKNNTNHLLQYEKEEAFLETLKTLNKLLN